MSVFLVFWFSTDLEPLPGFCIGGGGGGGGGGAHELLRHLIASVAGARTYGGIFPQEILKKKGFLGQHFVRFKDRLLGNKAGKSKEH